MQRWNIDSYWKLNCGPEMRENKDGLYVLHTDHIAEVEALKARLAVFEPVPSPLALSHTVGALKREKHSGLYMGKDWDALNEAIDWVRRIASSAGGGG
jgi:hypothetical protein